MCKRLLCMTPLLDCAACCRNATNMSSQRTDGRNCFAFPSCCSSSFASIDSSLQDVARTTCEKRDKMEDRSIFATTDFCTWLPINAVKRLGYAALWQRALQHPLHPGPQRGTLSAACIHLVDSWPFLLDGTGGFVSTVIFPRCWLPSSFYSVAGVVARHSCRVAR